MKPPRQWLEETPDTVVGQTPTGDQIYEKLLTEAVVKAIQDDALAVAGGDIGGSKPLEADDLASAPFSI